MMNSKLENCNSVGDKLKFVAMMRALNRNFFINQAIDYFRIQGFDIWEEFFESLFIDRIPNNYINLAISITHGKFPGGRNKGGKIGTYRTYTEGIDDGITPFFQKCCMFLMSVLGDKIQIIDNTQQIVKIEAPKQSISYRLDNEIIKVEIDDVVEANIINSIEADMNDSEFVPSDEIIEAEIVSNKDAVELNDIKTYTRNNNVYFNARDVWKQLNAKSSFSSWIKAKKRKSIVEHSIQTIEFRNGKNARGIDYLISLRELNNLKQSIRRKK